MRSRTTRGVGDGGDQREHRDGDKDLTHSSTSHCHAAIWIHVLPRRPQSAQRKSFYHEDHESHEGHETLCDQARSGLDADARCLCVFRGLGGFLSFFFRASSVFVFSWLGFLRYCVIDRVDGAFGRASALAMSQLTWWTSRVIFSIFT